LIPEPQVSVRGTGADAKQVCARKRRHLTLVEQVAAKVPALISVEDKSAIRH
jgi:hypothetical protein